MEGGTPIKVIVIEDEEPIRRFLRVALDSSGFTVAEAASGEEGIRQAATAQADAILLDLGLPDIDGMEVIKRIREWSQMPIIVLSARGQENDKVLALELGADDYLTKPFGVRELLVRLKVSLRHRSQANAAQIGGGQQPSKYRNGNLEVDFARRIVKRRGEQVHLTPIEYKLLLLLIRYAGKVVTHKQLLTEVWGPRNTGDTHYLRQYMGHLRHKLEDDPAKPVLLQTEPGVGYRFAEEPNDDQGGIDESRKP
jgi:two-component system KDP operon response regulator KdpE